tara:strand:+ start:157 stop:507 length:351 start_codon:yes stop_codon:yes gene_type:complete
MKYNSDFKYDLNLGLLGEKLINDVFENNDKVEVKTDFKAKDTGNIFIEYESRGKLSGISTTQANWFCFVLSNENIIFLKTEKLKKLCKQKGLRKVLGGDNNTSKGILLPINKLIKL